MFTTNFTFPRRNLVLHATGLQIALHIFLVQHNSGKEMFFWWYEMIISFFSFNHLLLGVVHKLLGVEG
jgi:hypothetical protein